MAKVAFVRPQRDDYLLGHDCFGDVYHGRRPAPTTYTRRYAEGFNKAIDERARFLRGSLSAKTITDMVRRGVIDEAQALILIAGIAAKSNALPAKLTIELEHRATEGEMADRLVTLIMAEELHIQESINLCGRDPDTGDQVGRPYDGLDTNTRHAKHKREWEAMIQIRRGLNRAQV